jgi:hypothetical protein
MHEYPIEDVHRLLDGLETLISNLRQSGPAKLRVDDLPELFETIHELGGWRNTTYLQTQVGINGSLLNKFLKLRGEITRADALKVADRLRTYLKSHDQASDTTSPHLGEGRSNKPASERKQSTEALVVTGEQWITVRGSAETKMKIAAIASLLDTIIKQTNRANVPPEDQFLTEIDRRQLIAILETALNILRSPMVERGLLKKAGGALKRASENAIEKGAQQGLGKLMESAGARLAELIANLFG